MDLPQPDRDFKLDYFISLMEDATDFCFESAKACHAVVLTTMELGKLSWHETEKLDRLRRTHAQKHLHTQKHHTQNFTRSESTQNVNQKGIICKYFTEGYCTQQVDSKTRTHTTKGVVYRHACHICDGPHSTRKCPPKSKNS